MPPELRWQSGRLLTDRSLVRSQVVARILLFWCSVAVVAGFRDRARPESLTPRTHGATAARRIPDPKVGGSNPSGFIPFAFFFPFRFWPWVANTWLARVPTYCLQSSVGRAVGC